MQLDSRSFICKSEYFGLLIKELDRTLQSCGGIILCSATYSTSLRISLGHFPKECSRGDIALENRTIRSFK